MGNVLVVDDDPFLRSVIGQMLGQDDTVRSLAASIHTVASAGEAMQVASRGLACLIVDLQLADGSGLDLAQRVRGMPGCQNAQVALLSSVYPDPEVVQIAQSQLGGRVFTKPYQLRHLSGFVARAFGRRVDLAEPSPPVETGGDLTERPLAAVLLDLWEAEATGRLSLRRGRVTKEVELLVGHPRSVASNVRDETLGHFLMARGVISREQHDRAIQMAADKRQKLGAALLSIGALTTSELIAQLTAQARFKLMRALRWPDGTWSFRPSKQPQMDFRGEVLEMLSVVMRGLRRTASIEPLPPEVAKLRRRPLHLTQRGTALLPAIRRVFGPRFVELWQDGATAESLLEAGMDRMGLFTVLEMLVLCDAIYADSRPPSDMGEGEVLSVGDLYDHSTELQSNQPEQSVEVSQSLYQSLFGDETTAVGLEPSADDDAMPVPSFADDSGVIEVPSLGQGELDRARNLLLEEYLRLQGASQYEVLEVNRRASRDEIEAAAVERLAKFSSDWFGRFDLGRDYAKLEEIHDAYDRARTVLLDPAARQEHDRSLDAHAQAGKAPTLQAELGFRQAEDQMAAGNYQQAIELLGDAVAAAPNEASYQEALGWAVFEAGQRSADAADRALEHLNQALAIDPDHPTAHEHKGTIIAILGKDDELAIMHLERALDADPTRDSALDSLETLWRRRGEMRPLERILRRVLFRLTGRDTERELKLWLKLANLYRNELSDLESTRIAYTWAARLQPENPAIQAALADLESGLLDGFHERAQKLRSEWRADPSTPTSVINLFDHARSSSRWDAAFIAASTLVAMAQAPQAAQEVYQRYRPRFVIRAQRTIEQDLWDEIRHSDDTAAIGHLFALLEPTVREVAPLRFADIEVDEATRLDSADLPREFVRVRSYVSHMLSVAEPDVYARPDFGRQIHIAAVTPPVLLVGDDAMSSPERSELAYRLGRAMSYLRPGRTVAASHPTRFLKSVVMAAFAATLGGDAQLDSTAHGLRTSIAELPSASRDEIARLLDFMRAEGRTINLSKWARAMARTADRVGLLLCGDLPAAARFAKELGDADAVHDLIDFALSPSWSKLRSELGLSIDV